jgi:hypothetical protein
MKTYTVGEIVRLGLLKNHKGEPYRHKATVLNILNLASVKTDLVDDMRRVATPYGEGYAVTQKAIDALNARWN